MIDSLATSQDDVYESLLGPLIHHHKEIDAGNDHLCDNPMIWRVAGVAHRQDDKKHFLGEEVEVLLEDERVIKGNR